MMDLLFLSRKEGYATNCTAWFCFPNKTYGCIALVEREEGVQFLLKGNERVGSFLLVLISSF